MSKSGVIVPVLFMVSGGSDSTAMLELACAYANGRTASDDELINMLGNNLPDPQNMQMHVLHVNHMLRPGAADKDEEFVRELCSKLDVQLEVQRVDIAQLADARKGGIEAVAREERYRLATETISKLEGDGTHGIICTAHTLDDRIETFFMRSLVGTGPGGLGSIPRVRGRIRRPLLDATREQLRDWLRAQHPGVADARLWREDATNTQSENFRSQVRMQLIPVLEDLRPGFARPLAQTMDLIAEEDEALKQHAHSQLYRNIVWDGTCARYPIAALAHESRPLARRILRECLLIVRPDARLESAQIERVLEHLEQTGYSTETSGGIRVNVEDDELVIFAVNQT